MNHQEQYEKDFETLKNRLSGAGYAQALDALAFAEKYHPGFRKDGRTPNFHHQIKIAFSLYDERERLRAVGLNVDEVITLGILHDTYEENQHIKLGKLKKRFGSRITEMTRALSKVRDGQPIPTETYYHSLRAYPETLIVKLHDRRSNVETIIDLEPKKQVDYVVETRQLLDVAKGALKDYPKLESIIQDSRNRIKAYLNLYLGFACKMRDGPAAETVRLLDKAGLLGEPAPSRPARFAAMCASVRRSAKSPVPN